MLRTCQSCKGQRRGFIFCSDPRDLIKVPGVQDINLFRAQGLFLEVELIDKLVDSSSILKVLGTHRRGKHAVRVIKRALSVMRDIHLTGITHGDLHRGNILVRSPELFGLKDEKKVKKKIDEFETRGDKLLVEPFIVDFGQSMSLNQLKSKKSAGDSMGVTRSSQLNIDGSIVAYLELADKDADKLIQTMMEVFFGDTPSALRVRFRKYYKGLP